MLSNASKKTVELNPVFREFLLSLGWIINANNMTSWCGMHYKNNENYVPLKLGQLDRNIVRVNRTDLLEGISKHLYYFYSVRKIEV